MGKLTRLCLFLSLLLISTSCGVRKDCVSIASADPGISRPLLDLNSDRPVLYKAGFTVLKYRFSGLIAFRRMETNNEVRIAFVSEAGPRIMEFRFDGTRIENTYCMAGVSKRSVIRFLSSFLDLLVRQEELQISCTQTGQPACSIYRNREDEIEVCTVNDTSQTRHLFRGRKNDAVAFYSRPSNIPDSIQVNMKYNTKITLKRISNAFK